MDEETQEHVRNWPRRAKENLRAAEHEFQGEFYARAVSTAYYVMFYAATAALKSMGEERAKHSGVISAFGEHFVRPGKISREIGRLFTKTMEDREESDYAVERAVRELIADANIDFGLYISARVISWQRFQTLPLRRPGLYANLCRDAIELWRRPGTENPLKQPKLALAA